MVEKLLTIGFDRYVAYDDIACKSFPVFSPQALHDPFLPRLKRLADTFTIPWVYNCAGDLAKILDDLLYLSWGLNTKD